MQGPQAFWIKNRMGDRIQQNADSSGHARAIHLKAGMKVGMMAPRGLENQPPEWSR